ncbi:NADH-quinone oxidoreductase subunit L [Pararhizobium mangrovi]|uniref:NADH-ubiquinone oxidoreductase chain 5 n=1 Tax=Pararhizobium mangrovi TaxID=2590452 RepID=A0A506U7P6_9HYPH|nr:NADH-quinone oxidoreductase subunit L [Pararhizobium mangrovi]TPW30442.1 NADH-quinone oxidoreductase subunit L [Pararhizobium mangrovi]
MYIAIVFLPLIGAIVAGLFGRSVGAKNAEYITCGFMGVSAVLSWIAFISMGFGGGEGFHVEVMRWMTSGDLQVNWQLRIDTLTTVMLVVVTTVSTLVHVYSIGYMHDDPHKQRFFSYLSLFSFAMLMLVTSNNLLQMFFGWEGVGLASYLLIGFWYKRPSACAAAMKAFIVNRVGDFGFALGIFAVFVLFGSISFDTIFANAPDFLNGGNGEPVINLFGLELSRQGALTGTCLLLFMGAMGKSAQFLLHTWLPDAMEGPTPVSALIHAATMVTAGVFLVARMSPLFEQAPVALEFITIVGSFTAFFAATIGLVQTDIKRVIAYSTCSQLGYMFAAMGVGAYGAGIFHLFTHAFFKALLFLCAGSVIHAVHDEQDMRRMGGLRKHIPKTYWTMVIGTLALTGFGIPFTLIGTAGFISKDAIIEASLMADTPLAGFAFWMLVIAAILTSFYSWRLIFMTFHGKPRASADVMHHVHESPNVMLVPLYVLSIGALFAGMIFKGFFFGHHYEEFWKGSLFTLPANHLVETYENIPEWASLMPFLAMAIGFVVAWYFYIRSPETPRRTAEQFWGLHRFLLNKWYIDELYDFLFVRPVKRLGTFLWKQGDGATIDHYGPDGVAARVQDITGRVVKLQSGYLYHYAFAMLIGVAALVTWMMFGSAIQ